jgi:flagellar protein FlaF
MGFSVSAGTAIVLIAAVASVGMLYTAGYNGYEQVQDARELDTEDDLAQANTEIEIDTVSLNDSTNPDTIEVTATNVGTTEVHVSDTDLLLNGTCTVVDEAVVASGDGSFTVTDGGTDLWQPHETLTLTVRQNDTAPLSVKLVTETGVADTEVGG